MFTEINILAERAKQPLKDDWLECLQEAYDEHHNYYRFLYHLTLSLQPAVCLEIGTWYGIGSAHMAVAAKSYGGQVIGIDKNQHELVRHILPRKYDNYHFIQGDSTEVGGIVKGLVGQYGPIGLVFQDSSHHYHPSCQEWDIYSPMLGGGAVWVCDDITEMFHDPRIDPPGKGMMEYFEERPGHKKVFNNSLHEGNTIGVILL